MPQSMGSQRVGHDLVTEKQQIYMYVCMYIYTYMYVYIYVCVCVCITSSLSIHLLMEGMYFFELVFLCFSSDTHLGVELLGYVVVLFLVF